MNGNQTAARPMSSNDAHWYCPLTATPRHSIMGKTTGRERPTTIRDARENRWFPSVTTVLKAAHKAALEAYKIEQAVLAALTTPRRDGEALDVFVKRVMSEDALAEAKKAADLGTRIHDAIESAVQGQWYDPDLEQYVAPVLSLVQSCGRVVAAEKIVVGDGYAGKVDLILEGHELFVIDFKSAKTMPKGEPWSEHQMQLGAYAAALGNTADIAIRCANVYISTTTPGDVQMLHVPDWCGAYNDGFKPLFAYWQYANKYWPGQREQELGIMP